MTISFLYQRFDKLMFGIYLRRISQPDISTGALKAMTAAVGGIGIAMVWFAGAIQWPAGAIGYVLLYIYLKVLEDLVVRLARYLEASFTGSLARR